MKKNKWKKKFQSAVSDSFVKYGLPVLLVLGIIYLVANSDLGDGMTSSVTEENNKNLSAQVQQYEDEVRKYAKQEGIGDYVDVLLALMMQESSGKGDDPMQASESLCGSVGCIENPERSIEHGVSYFAEVLKMADHDVKLALQSYNFGSGFIDYVNNHGGEYTQELAIEFSAQKYEELKSTGNYDCIREEAEQYDACYGDIYYVDAVLDYYDGDQIQES